MDETVKKCNHIKLCIWHCRCRQGVIVRLLPTPGRSDTTYIQVHRLVKVRLHFIFLLHIFKRVLNTFNVYQEEGIRASSSLLSPSLMSSSLKYFCVTLQKLFTFFYSDGRTLYGFGPMMDNPKLMQQKKLTYTKIPGAPNGQTQLKFT